MLLGIFLYYLLFSGLLTNEVAQVDNSVKKLKIKDSDSNYVRLAKSGGHTGNNHFACLPI